MTNELLEFTVLGTKSSGLGSFRLLKTGICYHLEISGVNKLIKVIDTEACSDDIWNMEEYRKQVFTEWKEYLDEQLKEAEKNPSKKHVLKSETVIGAGVVKRYVNTLNHLQKIQEKLEKVMKKYESV